MYNDIALHSAYDPQKEAERFLSSSMENETPGTIVILGAGLGYVSEYARKRFPASKIVHIWYSRELYEAAEKRLALSANRECISPSLCWHPGLSATLLLFLSRTINEFDLEGLKVLEWKPEADAFPSQSLEANKTLNQFIRELSGSLVTTERFGRRWIKNLIHNFAFLSRIAQFSACTEESLKSTIQKPVFIAASGPSLSKSFDILTRHRSGVFIISLPSSIRALLKNGIIPDLVVQTDPGNWASFHIHELSGHDITLAMPFSASRGAWRVGVPILPLVQNTFFETSFFANAPVQGLQIHPNGTVAASAFEIASMLTKRPIVFGGLDFCYDDIKVHVRPHTFDSLYERGASRENPQYSILYSQAVDSASSRDSGSRASQALKTYAGWFNHGMDNRAAYRIFPTEVSVEGLESLETTRFREFIEAGNTKQNGGMPWSIINADMIRSKEHARAVVEKWMKTLDEAEKGSGTGLSCEALELLYYIDTRNIIETRKRLRLGTAAGSSQTSIQETADHALTFLSGLRDCLL